MINWTNSSWGHAGAQAGVPRMAGMFPVAVPTSAVRGDEEQAARWRRVVLHLSDCFSSSAACHPHLAPYLLEALGNALEQLLLFGRERDLILLDEWLSEERTHAESLPN